MSNLRLLPCLDSEEFAISRRAELDVSPDLAFYQTRLVTQAVEAGYYTNDRGEQVDWKQFIVDACVAKRSIPPWQALLTGLGPRFESTEVQVSNETTAGAMFRLLNKGLRPLALNFANGLIPGGGFLTGARAQEESLCRISSLYWTLQGDRMYLYHSYREEQDSTDWAILSPQVPVFRNDKGTVFDSPLLANFITCAAPYAFTIGQPRAGQLLRDRIHRLLEIAHAYQFTSLILGAWGCGVFGNDRQQVARDFRSALEGPFAGAFSEVVFAVSDWSAERKTLRPFAEVFS